MGTAFAAALPLSKIPVAFGIVITGIVTGLDGSGFSGLPLVGSLARAAREDTEFHKTIAKIGSNKFLAAALDLIRQDGQLSPVFEYIREKVGSTVVDDHEKILQALKKNDPSAAEKAMAAHMENVIKDVNKYWNIDHGEESSEHAN